MLSIPDLYNSEYIKELSDQTIPVSKSSYFVNETIVHWAYALHKGRLCTRIARSAPGSQLYNVAIYYEIPVDIDGMRLHKRIYILEWAVVALASARSVLVDWAKSFNDRGDSYRELRTAVAKKLLAIRDQNRQEETAEIFGV